MDFDGSICEQDVTEALLERFADPRWLDLERELRAGRIGLRECVVRQAALLRPGLEEMLSFAMASFRPRPSFAPFVRWAQSRDLVLAVASDGLGFYIEPMLRAAGVEGVAVHTNDFAAADGGPRLAFPNAHPRCVGCGTCKMNVVVGYRQRVGPVAFVGEGHSDRYGALYADLTFARDALVEICERDAVPFEPWETFEDVRAVLERITERPGPVAPEVCPGWTDQPR